MLNGEAGWGSFEVFVYFLRAHGPLNSHRQARLRTRSIGLTFDPRGSQGQGSPGSIYRHSLCHSTKMIDIKYWTPPKQACRNLF
jgi:hypothetical protein